METIQIGATGHAFRGENFEEVGTVLRKHHISCIQLTPQKIVPGITWNSNIYTPSMARHIKTALHGVHISSLGCYIDMSAADETERVEAINRFKQNIVFAKYLGADMVATETGNGGNPLETHSEETYQRFLCSLREMVACAENFGVMIAIEAVANHTIDSIARVKRFLEDVPSPNIGLIYEVSGFMDRGEPSHQHALMRDFFETFAGRIKLLHLKDYRWENGSKNTVPLGEGELELDEYLRLVQKHTPYIDMIVEYVDPARVLAGIQTVRQRLAYGL